jgi:hypothetical protein
MIDYREKDLIAFFTVKFGTCDVKNQAWKYPDFKSPIQYDWQ